MAYHVRGLPSSRGHSYADELAPCVKNLNSVTVHVYCFCWNPVTTCLLSSHVTAGCCDMILYRSTSEFIRCNFSARLETVNDSWLVCCPPLILHGSPLAPCQPAMLSTFRSCYPFTASLFASPPLVLAVLSSPPALQCSNSLSHSRLPPMSHSNPIVETLTLVLSQSSSLETFILKYSSVLIL